MNTSSLYETHFEHLISKIKKNKKMYSFKLSIEKCGGQFLCGYKTAPGRINRTKGIHLTQ
jgi:DNA mismatch repair ATPase MutS